MEGEVPKSNIPVITSAPVTVTRASSKEEVALLGRMVSECMLSNSWFTFGSVVIGTVLGLRKKHLRPFVYSISLGTLADLFYGYTNSCRPILNDYEKAKASLPKMSEVLVEKTINDALNNKDGSKTDDK